METLNNMLAEMLIHPLKSAQKTSSLIRSQHKPILKYIWLVNIQHRIIG